MRLSDLARAVAEGNADLEAILRRATQSTATDIELASVSRVDCPR